MNNSWTKSGQTKARFDDTSNASSVSVNLNYLECIVYSRCDNCNDESRPEKPLSATKSDQNKQRFLLGSTMFILCELPTQAMAAGFSSRENGFNTLLAECYVNLLFYLFCLQRSLNKKLIKLNKKRWELKPINRFRHVSLWSNRSDHSGHIEEGVERAYKSIKKVAMISWLSYDELCIKCFYLTTLKMGVVKKDMRNPPMKYTLNT